MRTILKCCSIKPSDYIPQNSVSNLRLRQRMASQKSRYTDEWFSFWPSAEVVKKVAIYVVTRYSTHDCLPQFLIRNICTWYCELDIEQQLVWVSWTECLPRKRKKTTWTIKDKVAAEALWIDKSIGPYHDRKLKKAELTMVEPNESSPIGRDKLPMGRFHRWNGQRKTKSSMRDNISPMLK